MRFTKMHSVGNDYVVLDAFDAETRAAMPGPDDLGPWCRAACDRHFGIGADGVLILEPPAPPAHEHADARMTIVNADGSLGAMCANGLRAAAKLLLDRARIATPDGRTVRIAIHDRTVTLTVTRSDTGAFAYAEADMGSPVLELARIPVDPANLDHPPAAHDPALRVLGIRFVPVSMGNPHIVVPSDNPEADMRRLGALLETHPAFPHRTNVHFLQPHARDAAMLCSWERGVGHTLACGSGACAAIVAASLLDLLDPDASFIVPGGVLRARYDRLRARVFLAGTAATVFEGEWPGPPLAYAPRTARCDLVPLPLPTLRTARLVLRPFDWNDGPAIRAMLSEREVAIGIASAPHPYPPGEEHRSLARMLGAREDRRALGFAITLADTGEVVGSAGLRFDTPRCAELGYMLARPHWRRGYATEATRALLDFAFTTVGLDSVFAGHYDRNPASGRVLEKCGFVRADHDEVCPCVGTGRRERSIRYDLSREAWRGARSS